MAETVLRVEHVGMRFNLSKEKVDSLKDYILKSITRQMKFDEFWALKDINFTLQKGIASVFWEQTEPEKVPF